MLEPGQRLAGKYLLLQRLGAGGMGEVWLAMQEGSGTFRRRVVLKCLPEGDGLGFDERLANMLHDEARILGLLHHPGIVAPLDFIEGENGPILVLEQIDGPSLRTALRLGRKTSMMLPEVLAVFVGAQLGRALNAAHNALDEKGSPLCLVHRDVSPDNVLLSRDGRVRLADFGVAWAIGNMDVTNPGSAPKGKRGYMAPEQAAGFPVGPTADQFALGRVVAEAADIHCSARLRAVLDRATAPLAADRFPSADAMADALLEAVPIPADAQAQLAVWLQTAAAEAFATTETGAGSGAPRGSTPGVRKPFMVTLDPEAPPAKIATPPPAANPIAPPHPRNDQLFIGVANPRSRTLRMFAATGVVLALLLPLGLFVAAETHTPIGRALLNAIHAPTGDLHVGSHPDGAEVYVDGKLRGITPLALHLPAGRHAVRVGSLRLEKWHASEIEVHAGTEKQLEIDLNE